MQYALLIYSKPGTAEALSADEREANHREYMDIKKLPAVVGGASLHPVETATTVRVQDGQTLVTDDGRGGTPPAEEPGEGGGGFGIDGMRERACLLGGELTAGPRAGGGFRVAARLPVPAAVR